MKGLFIIYTTLRPYGLTSLVAIYWSDKNDIGTDHLIYEWEGGGGGGGHFFLRKIFFFRLKTLQNYFSVIV